MNTVFKTWNIESDQGLVFEPEGNENPELARDDIEAAVIDHLENTTDWEKDEMISEKIENASYPVYGFTTADKFETPEEYEAWLNEIWDEERGQYIEDATDAIIQYIRDLQEDLMNEIETIMEPAINRQNDYQPPCPICGMTPRENTEEPTYDCGHFVDVYNDWYHEDSLLWDYVKVSTHRVITSHDTAGQNEWFFAATPELDNILTASEAASLYGLAEDSVRQAIFRKTIKARKSAGTWLILRKDADKRWKK